MLGLYGYLINGIGPSLPGLRADLGVGYGVASLHGSLFAIGMVVAGVTGERIAGRLGRRRTFWLAAGAIAAGAWVFAFGRTLSVTLPTAFAMGTFGSLLVILVPAILSDRHGSARSTAFAEANAVSSAFGAVAPIVIGLTISAGLGWGPGLALPPTLLLVVLVVAFRSTPFPPIPAHDTHPAANTPGPRRLGPDYWRHWLTLVLVVAVEFCMIYWAAGYLQVVVGLSPGTAAASVAAFLGGMVAGRVVGGRVALRARPGRLLTPALGLTAAGFALFWSAGLPALAVLGLGLTGLGLAMLYPLALALAVESAAGSADLASARATLGSGVAITIAPLVLGWSADLLGLRLAYLLVPVLLVAAAVSVRIAGPRRERRAPGWVPSSR